MEAIDRWRAITLYGRNVATYKIALGKVLLDLSAKEKTSVDMPELAEAFLDAYIERLRQPRPQINVTGRRTLMERIVAGLSSGALQRHQAVEIVAREGFNDVVPRFHTLPVVQLEKLFYVQDGYRLRIDDSLIGLAKSTAAPELQAELNSRWSLLETAFEPSYTPSELWTDSKEIYYGRSFKRRAVTLTRPIIGGYQNGLCFYCGESLGDATPHVDHLIPRSFLGHDEIWNLVLSHDSCNLSKSDNLPPEDYVLALHHRNEYYIASSHPIKEHLIAATGGTKRAREEFLRGTYDRASLAIPRKWRLARIAILREPLESLALTE